MGKENASQFIVTIHPHPSIVGDGADLDEVQLIKQLRKCETSVLMNRGHENRLYLMAFILHYNATVLFFLKLHHHTNDFFNV